MKKQPGIANSIGLLTLLSVSPLDQDHTSLQAIADRSRWKLLKAGGVQSALTLLRRHKIPVVVCERDLSPETWLDLLDDIKGLPHPPFFIVISRLADERLWSDALQMGAWDVLAKPFARTEVIASVETAWQHWKRRIQFPAPAMKVMTAAG